MADEATPTAKPWWQSKTILLNILALVAMVVPAVREWVEKNPVEPLAVLSALNLLVRFVTSGRISIFPDDESGNGSSAGTGVSGGKGTGRQAGSAADGKMRRSGIPWLVAPACVLLAGCVVGVDEEGNYSLRPDPYAIDAALKYAIRHEDSAKGGLTEWEYFDPATGEKIQPEDYAAWGIKP